MRARTERMAYTVEIAAMCVRCDEHGPDDQVLRCDVAVLQRRRDVAHAIGTRCVCGGDCIPEYRKHRGMDARELMFHSFLLPQRFGWNDVPLRMVVPSRQGCSSSRTSSSLVMACVPAWCRRSAIRLFDVRKHPTHSCDARAHFQRSRACDCCQHPKTFLVIQPAKRLLMDRALSHYKAIFTTL